MAAGAGWVLAMAGRAIVVGRSKMGIMGGLVILGGMAGVTLVIRFNDWLAAGYARDMTACTADIVGRCMVVMAQ